MKPLLPRRSSERLNFKIRSYGLSAAVGLAAVGGALPQCQPAPPPAVVQVSDVQGSVVNSVNHQRALVGLAAMSVDGRLTAAAQGHSDDMARRQTMTHQGSDGTDGGRRANNAGYRWSTWGENVAAGQPTANEVMAAWLNSPGHRANILHRGVVHIGVAATTGSNGVIYWTMVVAAGS